MNEIKKITLNSLGYDFVSGSYLPKGKDEYHLRNFQNKNGIRYRNLSAYEIEVLVRNNNTSDNWNNLQVSDAFNPELVKNCKFFGLVRIGKLEPVSLEYHNVAMPVGLYNSTIISCDFGDNVIISNVNYMSHYIIGNEVMIANVHELHTTDHSKFGNGIIKEGEPEEVRIWLEVCNENGGRKILPFNGMLPADAHLWAKYRADKQLMDSFKTLTEKKFDTQRGYYGKVGDRSVIKNTSIIKDVWVGSEAYIKGANKLKNLTINSRENEETQIGEGCELVNGIINYGCRIFYGVKAVRFIMADHSQLKYGARLINSYLGENSTISCCEVLNSLIFPAHEQHHNNSFLCAALVMGQSNIAAGATIGSNHNSRAADGEMMAGRGFWPGLCVSLKHNSRFATFTLIAKGDYPNELNIPIPFSLISNDVTNNKLVIMPAYWFMYNMYALARNSAKYADRDNRSEKIQYLEYDYLAPDSVNEIFDALQIIRSCVAKAIGDPDLKSSEIDARIEQLDGSVEVLADGFECSNRPVQLVKVKEAFSIYKRLVVYYGVEQLLNFIGSHAIESFSQLMEALPAAPVRLQWKNIGGQLMPAASVETLIQRIKSGEIDNWDNVHEFYQQNGIIYLDQKLQHAYASLLQVLNTRELTPVTFKDLLHQLVETKEWLYDNIYTSRAKDYQNEFRTMMYDNDQEMEAVVGPLDENVFILQQKAELEELKQKVNHILKSFKL
ncbi:MAG: DUF4954 family protein [Candidatus Dadabacteria bacterium]